jgi:hypothetical protein
MHYLSSVYFVSQPLRVWGIFVAHHQEVHSIYLLVDCLLTRLANRQSTKKYNAYQLLFMVYRVYLLMMGYKNARNM